jgi:hypothetical protein
MPACFCRHMVGLTSTLLAVAAVTASGGGLGLFDHLIGAAEERERDREAKRLGGVEIDHQFELRRLHHWQVGGFSFLRIRPA